MGNAYTDAYVQIELKNLEGVNEAMQRLNALLENVANGDAEVTPDEAQLSEEYNATALFAAYREEFGDDNNTFMDICGRTLTIDSEDEGQIDPIFIAIVLGGLIQAEPEGTTWVVPFVYTGSGGLDASTLFVTKDGWTNPSNQEMASYILNGTLEEDFFPALRSGWNGW